MAQRVDAYGNLIESVAIEAADFQQPMDMQNRYQRQIQTHNAVSVAASSASVPSAYIDTLGFDKLAGTVLNDGATSSSVDIYWSNDNSTIHGKETVVATSTVKEKVFLVETKARYVKVVPVNGDAAAHTVSAWAFLKV